MGGLGPAAGAQAGAAGGDMGDLSKKVYQRPSLDDLDIEDDEEEDDMPDLEWNTRQDLLLLDCWSTRPSSVYFYSILNKEALQLSPSGVQVIGNKVQTIDYDLSLGLMWRISIVRNFAALIT